MENDDVPLVYQNTMLVQHLHGISNQQATSLREDLSTPIGAMNDKVTLEIRGGPAEAPNVVVRVEKHCSESIRSKREVLAQKSWHAPSQTFRSSLQNTNYESATETVSDDVRTGTYSSQV